MNLTINNYTPQKSKKTSFKALPTKICGFCYPEDIGVVLDSAMYKKHNSVMLGLLISLKHYALKGLSLNDKKAGDLLRLIREGSYQRNTNVKVACVNHCTEADELTQHIKSIYEHTFNGKNGLKSDAAKIARGFSSDVSKLLKGFDLIQIHDDMPLKELEKFSKGYMNATQDIFQTSRPKIIKAVHVPKQGDTYNLKSLQDYALEYANSEHVDGLILDSSNLSRDQIGGTGLVNDWNIARSIIDNVHKKTGKPVGLAGGLCPSNIKQAIEKVKPDFVDGNSGFRHDRTDKPIYAQWKSLYPGVCPPKDGVAVAEVLEKTADLPSTKYFDKYLKEN